MNETNTEDFSMIEMCCHYDLVRRNVYESTVKYEEYRCFKTKEGNVYPISLTAELTLEEMKVLSKTIDNCILGITANKERCKDLLESSVGIVTALCPYIGYKKCAALAKKSLNTGISIKELILSEKLLSPESLDEILDPVSMTEVISYDSKNMLNSKAV